LTGREACKASQEIFRVHSQQHGISPAKLCRLRGRSKTDAYPHSNSHRLGQPSEIGCATAHASPDHLPLRSVPSRGRLPARTATAEPLRLPEEPPCPTHLFTRRDRWACPRRHEASIVRLVAAQDVCGADQPVSGDRVTDFGSVTSAGLRHHPQRVANPQNEVSENPIGAVARHCRSGAGPLLDASSRSATRWRPRLRFG